MADAVTAAGGTAILTEIPEIFGAEQLLMARARDEAVFAAIVTLVNDFKAYFTRHGEPVSENPLPATSPAASPRWRRSRSARCRRPGMPSSPT